MCTAASQIYLLAFFLYTQPPYLRSASKRYNYTEINEVILQSGLLRAYLQRGKIKMFSMELMHWNYGITREKQNLKQADIHEKKGRTCKARQVAFDFCKQF